MIKYNAGEPGNITEVDDVDGKKRKLKMPIPILRGDLIEIDVAGMKIFRNKIPTPIEFVEEEKSAS